MSGNEFGTFARVLEFMEETRNHGVVSDLLREFSNELTDEQIDMLLARFWFHANREGKNANIKEEQGSTMPLPGRLDYV